MGDTVSHRAIVATARKEIRALRKPPGMRSDSWLAVRELLTALAGYLPHVWPTQRTLATKLGCSPMAIHRRVSTAAKHGLLVTLVHENGAWLDSTEYRLVCLSTALKATISSNGSSNGSVTQVSPPPPEEDRVMPLLRRSIPGAADGGAEPQTQGTVVPFIRPRPDDDDPRPIGALPEDEEEQRTITVPPVDQAAYLAKRFDDLWRAMSRRHRQWHMVIPSKRGMAVAYIKGVLLTQADPDVIEGYMVAYVNAVADGVIEPKLGQQPFMHFIGWWGSEEIEDPAVRADRQAMIASAKADYHRYLEEQGLA